MVIKKSVKKTDESINQYTHDDSKRTNNPPVGLVTPGTDPDQPSKKYSYDPRMGPQLQWSGKQENSEFEIDTVSLHIHERIDPLTILEKAMKQKQSQQQTMFHYFDTKENNPPLRDAIEFYKHDQNWSNRLIAGDSLLVMNSLLEKEGMEGKVQMVYMDPPYGIKYGSNFQPFVNKRDVKDGNDEDLTQEPETIRAFRDTWELGIHSYLTYLQNRLYLAHKLLHETGSCFVQISEVNLHHVREIMDSIFGSENFVATIVFRKKKMPLGAKYLEYFCDYIIFYAKSKNKLKYRQLFKKKSVEGDSKWCFVELADGTRRRMTSEEHNNHKLLPKGSNVYLQQVISPAGFNSTGVFPVKINNKIIHPPLGKSWKTSPKGMERLIQEKRVELSENEKTLNYVLKLNDYPVSPLNSLWTDTSGAHGQKYVVETSPEVIKRCILMSTDPGDLVFDLTCGSGTTAKVAETWGRRWITCDTSRVAIILAKQRLMTSIFDYYKLSNPKEGISSGFEYNLVQHITLGTIANNDEAKNEILYDQPFTDNKKSRITGPFTLESVPSPIVKSIDTLSDKFKPYANQTKISNQEQWRHELLKTGIRGKAGQKIEFTRVESHPATKWIHADAETKEESPKRVMISFGPEHAPLEQRQVALAIEEAQSLVPNPKMIIFAAMQFDPEAAKDIDELNWPDVTILKAEMNKDLLTADLKKKRSNNESFWLLGQPDIKLQKTKDKKYIVSINGFDYYNTKTGEIESGDSSRIAMWMLDTDYDGRSVYPQQVFFPMEGKTGGWIKLAKTLQSQIDEELIEKYQGTESIPFESGFNKRVAVKIIDDRGIESLKIIKLE